MRVIAFAREASWTVSHTVRIRGQSLHNAVAGHSSDTARHVRHGVGARVKRLRMVEVIRFTRAHAADSPSDVGKRQTHAAAVARMRGAGPTVAHTRCERDSKLVGLVVETSSWLAKLVGRFRLLYDDSATDF